MNDDLPNRGDTRHEPYSRSRTPIGSMERLLADLLKAEFHLQKTIATIREIIKKL